MIIGAALGKRPNVDRYFRERHILHLQQRSELIISVHDVQQVVVPPILAQEFVPLGRHRLCQRFWHAFVDFICIPAGSYPVRSGCDFPPPTVSVVGQKRAVNAHPQFASATVLQRFDVQRFRKSEGSGLNERLAVEGYGPACRLMV